jgi:hypothetical protein
VSIVVRASPAALTCQRMACVRAPAAAAV